MGSPGWDEQLEALAPEIIAMTDDKNQRKQTPICTGVLEYFPDAIAAVARVSYVGNVQHNGEGAPLYWDRSKSQDHVDCLVRHLLDRGAYDTDGTLHSAKVAWRALAQCQIEIESQKAPTFLGKPMIFVDAFGEKGRQKIAEAANPMRQEVGSTGDLDYLLYECNCPTEVAYQIAKGITYAWTDYEKGRVAERYCYISGPMRGLPEFNFPAFDKARDELLREGYNVISPADIDRAAMTAGTAVADNQCTYAFRDFHALHFLKKIDKGENMLMLMAGWEKSTGANAELGIAKWLGLKVRGI